MAEDNVVKKQKQLQDTMDREITKMNENIARCQKGLIEQGNNQITKNEKQIMIIKDVICKYFEEYGFR